jgi:pimeloyl-ACP methyl ester carboxylesterase
MRSGTLAVREGTLETAWWGPGPSEAPTLVLLHEGLGCVELWRDVPEHLAAATGWGVFAYSRFGYGRSDLTTLPRPMDYMQQEALVVLPQVLDAAGIEQAVLLGHSDGGSIAAVYAEGVGTGDFTASCGPSVRVMAGEGRPPTSGDRTPGKVVDDPAAPGHDTIKPAARGHGTIEPAACCHDTIAPAARGHGCLPHLLGLVTIAAHFFVEEVNLASIRQIRDTYETGDLRDRMARYHRDVDVAFRGWNDAWLDPRFRDFDITGFLPGIRVPTLGLQGSDDPYGTDEQLRALQANVSAPIEIELIPGARHAPHLEAKEHTLAVINRFISRLPRDLPT